MKKAFGTLLTIIILVLFAGAAGKGFQTIKTRQERALTNQTSRPAMQFVTPKEGAGLRTIPALATLKSRATIKVMPEAAGKITFLNKREGDTVTAGEVIARIESNELQTQLRVAGAQSSSAEKQTNAAEETIKSLSSQRPALVANEQYWRAEQDRDQKLFLQGALSKAQWEGTANKLAEAQGKLAALDGQINAARAQKQAVASQKDAAVQTVALWKVRTGYAEVTAPVAGIISARIQEEGNYVTPNSVLYQLEETQSCRLVMQIPQQYSAELMPGQPIVTADSNFPEFRLTRIYPTNNELRQRTIEAEAVEPLPNPELDRQFTVNLVAAKATGLLLPANTFFQTGADARIEKATIAVYVLEGTTVKRKAITPLLLTDSGEAVIEPSQIPSTGKLLQLGFMEFARMPETITLTGAEIQ